LINAIYVCREIEATVSSLLDTVRQLTDKLKAAEQRISALEVSSDKQSLQGFIL
jgi:hypothetical protein